MPTKREAYEARDYRTLTLGDVLAFRREDATATLNGTASALAKSAARLDTAAAALADSAATPTGSEAGRDDV